MSSSGELTVAVRHVHRRFGDVQALDDLTLEVPTGKITVLLGPNGAGKTTAIRVVTGALAPDAGTVSVFGLDPAVDGEEVRRRCGVVSAKPSLYDRLSGWDNLDYAAALYGVDDERRSVIADAAARFGIEHALDQQVGGYSTGMKTRLALARSVLHRPELLLFDEPTSGLDPESSAAVLALIREMTAEGSTVVMCTHHLVEAEGLSDRIVVLDGGHDLVAGAPADLVRRYWPTPQLFVDAEDPRQLARVTDIAGVIDFRPDPRPTVVLESLAVVPDVIAGLSAAGVRLTRAEPHEPSLEDLYFAVRAERAAHQSMPTVSPRIEREVAV